MKTLLWALCLSLFFTAAAPAVTITGAVLGPDGKPVAGATVAAYFYRLDDNRQTITDVDGHFTLTVELPETKDRYPAGRVAIYRPGLAVGGGSLPREGATYTLTASAQASGIVVDAQGKPVADAIVRVTMIRPKALTQSTIIPDTLREAFTARSDAAGRWTVNDVPAIGKASVQLDDPRFVIQFAQVELGGDAPPLKARPAAVITGLARFEDGKPAAGMRVVCQGVESHDAWAEATTGADGHYRLAGLSTGPVNVMLDDPKGEWVAAALPGVRAVEGQEITAGDLLVTAGAFIEGDVTVKETGKPVPDLYIGSYGPHRPRSSAMIISARTDARGHYRLRVAPGQSYIYISGDSTEYLPTAGVNIEAKPGETKILPFRLSTGVVITGRLIDTDGKPVMEQDIPLALVDTTPTDGYQGYVEPRRARAGEGAFTFSGLTKGTSRLLIDYSGNPCAWELVSPVDINVPVGGPLTITLRKSPLRTLAGRVVTPDGQPVAGVKVTLDEFIQIGEDGSGSGQELVTGADGAFSLPDISPTVKLTFTGAEKEGYKYISGGKVTDGAQPAIADIVLAPLNTTVRGTVTDAAGKPAAGALVISAEAGMASPATTDAAGAFTLTGLPAGGVTLLAAQDRSFAALALKPGETQAALVLAPAPAQPPQDLARGRQMLEALLQETAGKNYYARDALPIELLPYDPKGALAMQPAGGRMGGYALAQSIADNIANATPQDIDDCLRQLDQTADPQEKLMALSLLGTALAAKDRARAQDIYTRMKALAGAGGDPFDKAFGYTSLAKLAYKLDNGEAEGWLAQAMTIDRGMKDDQGLGSAIAESLAEVNPRAAVALAKTLPVDEHSAPSAMASIIEIIARTDAPEAKRLLAEMPKGDDWSTRYSYGYAAKYVVTALAKDDPVGALTLAREITEPKFRMQSLAATAPFLPKEEAVKVLREAAAASATDDQGLEDFIKLAAAASSIDKTVGNELLTEATQRVEAKNTNHVSLAYALRDSNPALSRLLLEATVRQLTAKPDAMNPGGSLLQAALTMAPLDFDRALEIARAIPADDVNHRCDAERKLIQYLLAPPAVRANIPLDRWTASDTWRPGMPTNW